MARTLYGGTPGDVVAAVGTDGDFEPTSGTFTVWDAGSAGTQLTDLLTYPGEAETTTVSGDARGTVLFYAPDGHTGAVWIEDSTGYRWRIDPADLADRVGVTSWAELADKPTTFPPEAHDHDERYYTAAEVDALVDGAGGAGLELLTWHVPGELAVTGDDTVPLFNDHTAARTIVAVRATVGTSPATTGVIVDLNVNGTSVFTTQANRPTITPGQFTSGKRTNMNTTAWPAGAALSVAVDQVGSATAPGKDLVVQVLVA